jgi:Osmosensitive K+ channel histidine kinase
MTDIIHGTSVTEQELNAEMLATISHELRTPLTSIKGYATTLMRGGKRLSPIEAQEYLQAIEEGCERLNVIIEHFLELSQFETHMVTLNLIKVDLLNFLQQFILSYTQLTLDHEQHPTTKINLTVISDRPDGSAEKLSLMDAMRNDIADSNASDISPQQSDPLSGDIIYANIDLKYMQKALLYLLDNAIKYSSAPGTIDFSVRLLPATNRYTAHIANNQVTTAGESAAPRNAYAQSFDETLSQPRLIEINIQDHGIGIESDQLEHIFERFYRVDRNLTREVNGLGIGLTICKYIIELHHGTIWVDSEPGNGSIFHILLPVALWSNPMYGQSN